jgi:ATP-binding cassette subfamily B protein
MLGFAMMYTIYLRYNGGISMGDFAFVMGLVFTSVDHSWRFTSEVQNFIQQLGSLNSSIELLNRDETREYLTLPNIVKSNHGEIEITNLTFAYNQGVNIFQDFNLHIPAGQKVGIVGHSGSGKSTLVSIILKNLIPQKGEVKIDNLSIYDYNEDSVRDQIALIPQDTILFHRSIFENIAYPVPNASLEDVVRVANIVKLDEVIESMPQKYNTLVGERGIKLSGGQRQRVAIARAMLKKAPIMILDEATSSLDSLTESEIQKSLNQMLSLTNSTVIAIAHRLSTIRNLDRIVVMNQGKIIEDGTFNDLINKPNGKFRELWNNQVNGMLV